jgi:hypothetical protein
MQKYRILTIILVGLNSVGVFAQQDTAEDALKHAQETQRYVNDHIERKEFLLNEFKVNATRYSLHQPGYFQHLETYFYTFDKRESTLHQPLLQSVILRTEKGGVSYFKEYIFDNDGNCIYYAEMQREEGKPTGNRLKIYLGKEKALRWLREEREIADQSEKPESKVLQIMNDSKKMKLKFSAQFSDIQFH